MPEYLQPFSLGNVLQQGQGIKNLRSRNALMEQSLADQQNPNSLNNQYMRARINDLNSAGEYPGIQDPSFRDATAASLAEYRRTGDPGVLVRFNKPASPIRVDTGNATEIYTLDPDTRQPVLVRTIPHKLPPEQELEHIENAASARQQGQADVKLETDPELEAAKIYAIDDANTITAAQNQINVMLKENRNFDSIMALVEKGADTGPLVKYWPTMRGATIALEQKQKEMGLDVVGAVTFGALSKGELDLALQKALPTDMDGPELIQWAKDKQAANNKLAEYYLKQIEFMRGGGTKAEWLRKVKDQGGINASADANDDDPLGLRQ